MKNTILIFTAFFLVSFTCNAQNDKIEFFEVRSNNLLEFKIINHNKLPNETELKVTNLKGLRGNRTPVTKIVQPKDTVTFYTFTIIGASSYNYTFNSWAVFDMEEYSASMDINIQEGIVVFYKSDCPRSQHLVKYLNDKNRDFQIVDITDKGEKHSFMYSYLRYNKQDINGLIYPVVVIDGKIHYNFDIPTGYAKLFN